MTPASALVDVCEILEKLRGQTAVLCAVESCTGGMLASRITDVPGCSDVFWGSFVTYDNSAKEQLGVARDLILRHGAVSSEIAVALAEAGLKRVELALPARKKLCLSTTGIAGPTGGSEEKPVGLCFVAVAGSGLQTQVRRLQAMPGAVREANKAYFTEQALSLLLEAL